MRVFAYTIRHRGRTPSGRLGTLLVVLVAFVFVGPIAAQGPATASFDSIAPDNPAAEAGDGVRGADVPTLSFSFRFAPWEDVLTKFAEVAGLTLDLTEVPSGTFNYYDKGSYSPPEALDIMNGYLLQRGFVLVRRDRFLVCVNLEKGVPANLVPMVTVDQLADYGNNELVSVIFTHENMDAGLAASQVEQFQGPHGKVVSLNASNSLHVTDTGGNLRLIQRLLDEGAFSRRVNGSTGPAFKSFALQYVRADEAERLIRTLFGLSPALSSATAAAMPRASISADLTITTDARTNRLFVTGASAKLASIEQIIADYDVAAAATDGAPRRSAPTTRILSVPNADVIIIGQVLESLSPRIRVSTTRSTRRSASTEADTQSTSTPKPDDASRTRASSPAATTPSPDGRDR